jgi:hypothetical protein
MSNQFYRIVAALILVASATALIFTFLTQKQFILPLLAIIVALYVYGIVFETGEKVYDNDKQPISTVQTKPKKWKDTDFHNALRKFFWLSPKEH